MPGWRGGRYAPAGKQWNAALAHWQTLASDPGAHFDAEIRIDAAMIAPMVSWGTSPEASVTIDGQVPDDAETAPTLLYGP